jgi:hypothetical protein
MDPETVSTITCFDLPHSLLHFVAYFSNRDGRGVTSHQYMHCAFPKLSGMLPWLAGVVLDC